MTQTIEKIMELTLVLGVSLLCGSVFGNTIVGIPGHLSVGILGFDIGALLYLVAEELLTEAHEVEDTPFITAMFFPGFLLPLLLGSLD